MEFPDFLTASEKLVAERGTPNTMGWLGGTLFREISVFESPGFKVTARGQALEVSITYQDADKKPITNPVVCRDEKGKVYRQHGEWRFGIRRLERLLAGETVDGPITVERGPQGWDVGAD